MSVPEARPTNMRFHSYVPRCAQGDAGAQRARAIVQKSGIFIGGALRSYGIPPLEGVNGLSGGPVGEAVGVEGLEPPTSRV